MGEGFPGKGNRGDWSSALPYYNLANRYMAKERFEDAAAKYQEAISRYEFDPDFYLNLGVALRKLENFQGAEEAFKKAAELNEKDWMSWSNLANSYLKQDRLEETIKAFEKALKCNPPAAEKEAINKDIADIKKILSVRNGTLQPPPGKSPPSAKILTGGKGGAPSASKLPPKANSGANKAPESAKKSSIQPSLVKQTAKEAVAPKPRPVDETTGTGWDEVAK